MKYGIIILAIGVVLIGGYVAYNYVEQEDVNNDVLTNTTTITNTAVEDVDVVESDVEEEIVATESNCIAEDCLKVSDLEYPVGDLSVDIIQALDSAIDDEYKARATYEAVINEFGSVRPFSMIIRAEEQHISSLKSLYDKYGAVIPEDPYDPTVIELPTTLQETCQVGVDAEIFNAALYREELLPAVTEYEDITTVFISLMNASQDKHLAAFEKCN